MGISKVIFKEKESSKANLKLTLILIIWWTITHRFLAGLIYLDTLWDLGKMYNLKLIFPKRKTIKIIKTIHTLYMVEIQEVNASKVKKISMKPNHLIM